MVEFGSPRSICRSLVSFADEVFENMHKGLEHLRRLCWLALCALACLTQSAFAGSPQPRLVVLFVPCSLSKDHLQPYDEKVVFTPNLAAFAKRSVVFQRHQTETGVSGPSYASIFSGTQVDRHGVYHLPARLDDEAYLITEAFAENGYATYYWSGHPAASPQLNFSQGVRPDHTREFAVGDPAILYRIQSINEILDRLSADPNYKALLITTPVLTHSSYSMKNWKAFHRAYPAAANGIDISSATRFAKLYRSNHHLLTWNFDLAAKRLDLSGERLRRLSRSVELLYESNVNRLDRVFGTLLNEIDSRGFRDQSLVAFTADHGEVMYRDNAPFKWSHGLQLAPEALNVPFIVSAPGLPVGTYEGVTRSIDVFPTLAGLAGVSIDPKHGVQGVDLAPSLRGKAPAPKLLGPSHTAVLAPSVYKQMYQPRWREIWSLARGFFPEIDVNLIWVTIRDGDMVYKHKKVDKDTWKFQAFDLAKDPEERSDLYDPAKPRHVEMVQALKDYKARLVAAHPQSRAEDRPELVEDQEAELLRGLGYIQ